jgi:hypothetical protein
VQRKLMQGVPRNINAAERKARQNLPEDFYAGRTSASAKAGEGDHP